MSDELDLEESQPVTSAENIRALLRRKFPPDQYAMVAEVRDAAGFSANRSCDVLVMGLWPSRGLELYGIEIKVSRSDWLRELKDAAKAEAFARYCDRWFVAAGSRDIVKAGELPDAWGLIVPSRQGVTFSKPAAKLQPEPIPRGLLAALLKRACGATLEDPEIRAEIEAKVKAAKADQAATHANDLRRARRELELLQQGVADFERASGVRIADAWNGRAIGEAVAMVRRGEDQRIRDELEGMRDKVERLHERMQEILGPRAEPGT